RIPRMRRGVITQPLPVDMPEHSRTLGAAGPVVTGLVLTRRKRSPVGLRAGQGVVPVGGVAATVDDIALLGQRRLLADVVVAVQFGDILGDDRPFVVLPRTFTDPISRIDRRLTVRRLGAEIGVPGMAPCSDSLGQLLADPIRPRQAAEIGTLT